MGLGRDGHCIGMGRSAVITAPSLARAGPDRRGWGLPELNAIRFGTRGGASNAMRPQSTRWSREKALSPGCP